MEQSNENIKHVVSYFEIEYNTIKVSETKVFDDFEDADNYVCREFNKTLKELKKDAEENGDDLGYFSEECSGAACIKYIESEEEDIIYYGWITSTVDLASKPRMEVEIREAKAKIEQKLWTVEYAKGYLNALLDTDVDAEIVTESDFEYYQQKINDLK